MVKSACLAILVQYRRVADGQMDREHWPRYALCIASRGKKTTWSVLEKYVVKQCFCGLYDATLWPLLQCVRQASTSMAVTATATTMRS